MPKTRQWKMAIHTFILKQVSSLFRATRQPIDLVTRTGKGFGDGIANKAAGAENKDFGHFGRRRVAF